MVSLEQLNMYSNSESLIILVSPWQLVDQSLTIVCQSISQ